MGITEGHNKKLSGIPSVALEERTTEVASMAAIEWPPCRHMRCQFRRQGQVSIATKETWALLSLRATTATAAPMFPTSLSTTRWVAHEDSDDVNISEVMSNSAGVNGVNNAALSITLEAPIMSTLVWLGQNQHQLRCCQR